MFKEFLKDLIKLRFNYAIGKKTWFGSGGNSLIFLTINTLQNLIFLIKLCPKNFQILVFGAGSNVIVRDGGIKGITIKLGNEFKFLKINKNEKTLEIGGSAKDSEIVKFCEEKGISGFEFLKGIPGTLGGNIRMNAGCYGKEISDYLLSCTIINRSGKLLVLQKKDIKFGYRSTSISKDSIIINAKFKISFKKNYLIKKYSEKLSEIRKKTQPYAIRTGGSTFTNPKKKSEAAWKLIDKIGYRGKKLGGASVSSKHSNFLINENVATSLDLELLGEEIREKIKKKYKINLEWEILRIGKFKKI